MSDGDIWNNGAFQDVIDEHFPDHSLNRFELLLINAVDLVDKAEAEMVDKAEELERVKKLENALLDAWVAFSEIHPSVKRRIEESFGDNSRQSPALRELKVFSQEEPLHVADPFALHLQTLLGHFLGQDPDQVRPGKVSLEGRKKCSSTARSAVEAMRASSTQQRSNETIEKAVLISNARQLWKKLASEVPPFRPSEGSPFYNFVADLILALEKEWDPESTFRAWQRICEGPDSWPQNKLLSYP